MLRRVSSAAVGAGLESSPARRAKEFGWRVEAFKKLADAGHWWFLYWFVNRAKRDAFVYHMQYLGRRFAINGSPFDSLPRGYRWHPKLGVSDLNDYVKECHNPHRYLLKPRHRFDSTSLFDVLYELFGLADVGAPTEVVASTKGVVITTESGSEIHLTGADMGARHDDGVTFALACRMIALLTGLQINLDPRFMTCDRVEVTRLKPVSEDDGGGDDETALFDEAATPEEAALLDGAASFGVTTTPVEAGSGLSAPVGYYGYGEWRLA